jgi:hypothetical protein
MGFVLKDSGKPLVRLHRVQNYKSYIVQRPEVQRVTLL